MQHKPAQKRFEDPGAQRGCSMFAWLGRWPWSNRLVEAMATCLCWHGCQQPQSTRQEEPTICDCTWLPRKGPHSGPILGPFLGAYVIF